MASERRRQRIAEVFKEQIGDILLREEDWPEGVMVTVTRVALSDDLEHANAAVSVLPDEACKEVFAMLERDVGAIQHLINRRMRMRPVPKIRFMPEKEVVEAARIEAELYKLSHGE